jgi:hypothetical protein
MKQEKNHEYKKWNKILDKAEQKVNTRGIKKGVTM